MRNVKIAFTAVLLLSGAFTAVGQNHPFRNPDLSLGERVDDLVSRLTLDEKVAQMLNDAPAVDRLSIPAYNWWNECLHGVGRTDYRVTVFPQAIGMAATWDKVLLENVAAAIAEEGRAIYNDASSKGNRSIYHGLTYWTPNINIFRDPRWGRGQETYGEDPFLTGAMGKAFVVGLQGDDPAYLKAAACAKHYAVHSGPENTRHTFNTFVTDFDLWDTYLPAFRELVVDAGVAGVMCAYNAFDGAPCCGNNLLMMKILREAWGFEGYVTSDCGAIEDFFERHKTHVGSAAASADAVINGTDLECGNNAYRSLVDAVSKGLISEEQIDVSVKRLFGIRFRLGLFDEPEKVPYARIPLSVLECPGHRQLSLRTARESIVLLRNENNMLPLRKNLKRVAVIGPNADDEISLLGNYNGFPSEIVTPYEAIKEKLGKADVVYEKGIDFTGSPEESEAIIKSIVERHKNRDVVIYAGGISPRLEGEEMPVNMEGFAGGDRTSIKLPAIQTRLMQELRKAGIPVVFVMMSGSAVGIEWESEHIPAIICSWYGGQDAGTAIADVLFGDYNPSGRLPVTFYAKDSDLPPFNSYDMKNRTYRFFKGEALYPFGYGLSYTGFEYSNLRVPDSISASDGAEVTVNVKNTGKIRGDEVVQLYVTHNTGEHPVPLFALKGFERVSLDAGESMDVTFRLTPRDLGRVDRHGGLLIGPGSLTIHVGGTSPALSRAVQLPVISKTVEVGGYVSVYMD